MKKILFINIYLIIVFILSGCVDSLTNISTDKLNKITNKLSIEDILDKGGFDLSKEGIWEVEYSKKQFYSFNWLKSKCINLGGDFTKIENNYNRNIIKKFQEFNFNIAGTYNSESNDENNEKYLCTNKNELYFLMEIFNSYKDNSKIKYLIDLSENRKNDYEKFYKKKYNLFKHFEEILQEKG